MRIATAQQPSESPAARRGGDSHQGMVGASESRLLKLYDHAHLSGMNVSYCGRKDDAGEFRRAVTVSADVRRFVWRYYTPETECDALEEALNEAVKIYGRTPLRNYHQTNDGRDSSEGESAASARCSNGQAQAQPPETRRLRKKGHNDCNNKPNRRRLALLAGSHGWPSKGIVILGNSI